MTEYSPASHPVREMFGSIAEKYDITNTALSMGMHHLWKRGLIGMSSGGVSKVALDLCTGTGDLLPRLEKKFGKVVGADFCGPMLKVAAERFNGESKRFELVEADAMALPFPDQTFDTVTVSFGVRNFRDLKVGLIEIKRVLKKEGEVLILEFGQPSGFIFGPLFRFYSKYIIPLIGGALTGNKQAYTYLPETSKNFPCGQQFAEVLTGVGFTTVSVRPCSFGIAYIYKAKKT